jgi:hypothetical protein
MATVLTTHHLSRQRNLVEGLRSGQGEILFARWSIEDRRNKGPAKDILAGLLWIG